MHVSDKVKKLDDVFGQVVQPEVGQFSLEIITDKKISYTWQKCRDTFSTQFTEKTDGFLFSNNKIEPVASFMCHFEEVLKEFGVNLKNSIFYKTQSPYAFWVEPSEFWKNCCLKRSLFTALLRSGIEFKGDNFEKALYSKYLGKSYLEETKLAVERFMFGFTEFNLKKWLAADKNRKWINTTGWHVIFTGKDSSYIKEHLTVAEGVKPLSFNLDCFKDAIFT